MKEGEEDWRVAWIKSLKCEFWYKVEENEVWKSQQKIIVWHPKLGLRTMFNLSNMSEKIQKEVIENTLKDQQEKIDKITKTETRTIEKSFVG